MPTWNTFESTLIGTGGGYGESQVVHLGCNHWIVIDSCQDPDTKESLPLRYLQEIGVNLQEDVKMIICTHWHDDHIRGISNLLEKCQSAIFSFARTTDRKKFLRLLGLDYRKAKIKTSKSSTSELNKCLDIIEERRQSVKEAIEDRILLSHRGPQLIYEVISLSPSDYVMRQFNGEISSLITDFGETNRKIKVEDPNSKSVAIYLKVNDHRIILGSDLEVDLDSNEKGWLRILENNQTIDKKATLFKIPHHGSTNGDHDRIWNEIIEEAPISKLSPWNRKDKLPKLVMLERIMNKSYGAFITSTLRNRKAKPKNRDRVMAKVIKMFKPSLDEVTYTYGMIRCQTNIQNSFNIWSIECFGEAASIDDKMLAEYPVR